MEHSRHVAAARVVLGLGLRLGLRSHAAFHPLLPPLFTECAVILTPELCAKMLTVWERRQRDPRNTVYPRSLLDAALSGLPDFPQELPNFVRRQKAKQDSPPLLEWKPVLHWKR